MYVLVTVKLEESNRTINLANAKRINVGTFQEAAKILDRILAFLSKIPSVKDAD